MFDRMMQHSLPMWLLVSALFPIFFFGTLIKAFLHFRRLRALPGYVPHIPVLREPAEAEDWIPSR